jgi:hypothetical protein
VGGVCYLGIGRRGDHALGHLGAGGRLPSIEDARARAAFAVDTIRARVIRSPSLVVWLATTRAHVREERAASMGKQIDRVDSEDERSVVSASGNEIDAAGTMRGASGAKPSLTVSGVVVAGRVPCQCAECGEVFARLWSAAGAGPDVCGRCWTGDARGAYEAAMLTGPRAVVSLVAVELDEVAARLRAIADALAAFLDDGEVRHRCDNCGKVWADTEIRKEIADYFERVDSDNEPSGECPECGALCYEVGDAGDPRRV